MKTLLIISGIILLIHMNLSAQITKNENLKFHPGMSVAVSLDLIPIIDMPSFDLNAEYTDEMNSSE